MEGHVIADKNSVADGELQGKALVVGRSDANSRATFFGDSIIRVDHPKEFRFLYGELFFDDGDTTGQKLTFEGLHQVVMRYRRPGFSRFRGFEGLQPFTVDVLCTRMSDQTSRHISLLTIVLEPDTSLCFHQEQSLHAMQGHTEAPDFPRP